MTTPSVYANSNTWLGCAIEPSPTVPQAAPLFWIPVVDPMVNPDIGELLSQDMRGQMNANYGQTQGVKYSRFAFKCLAHVDVLPHLVRSALGSADSVTGAGPYDHTLSLLNTPAPAQPPTYTWFDYDGFRVRRMAGGRTDELTLDFRADGLVEVTAKVVTYPFDVIGYSLASISQVPPTTGWDMRLTLNSVALSTLTKGRVTLRRGVVPIPTLGQQTPYRLMAGPLAVSGSLSLLNIDDSELDIFLTNASVPLALAFTNINPVQYGFTLNMSTCKASLGAQERGADGLITTTIELQPIPNTNDATAGGSSPIKGTFTTPQAAAY